MSESLQPGLAAYLQYIGGFLLRYGLLAGGATVLLHVVLRRAAMPYRIQMAFPSAADLRREIGWSFSNSLCTGLSTMLTLWLIASGRTSMYLDVAEYGWAWLAASALLGVLGYDTWFYWQHRLLHTRWMYERFHAVHHRSTNPTPLAGFAHHPVETFLGNAFFVLLVVAVPMHPLALGAVGLVYFGLGIVSHLGYELYPAGFARHPVLQWINTATHHNMHHTHAACNYGLLLQWWDRLLATNHPSYLQTYDLVTARRTAP
ncbi:MAG TPA: sterol desaturase family protein [Candidatus Binatia bacterium]|nr:sterol desaturase family protein [Candidatus Binatia bacterium]